MDAACIPPSHESARSHSQIWEEKRDRERERKSEREQERFTCRRDTRHDGRTLRSFAIRIPNSASYEITGDPPSPPLLPSITHPAGSLTEIYMYTLRCAHAFSDRYPLHRWCMASPALTRYLALAPSETLAREGGAFNLSPRREPSPLSLSLSLSLCMHVCLLSFAFSLRFFPILFLYTLRRPHAAAWRSIRVFRLYRAAHVRITRGCYRAIVNFADQRLREEFLVPVSYHQATAFNTERRIHVISLCVSREIYYQYPSAKSSRKWFARTSRMNLQQDFDVTIAVIVANEISETSKRKVSMISHLPFSASFDFCYSRSPN